MKKILGLVAGLLLTAVTYAQSTASFVDANDTYKKETAMSYNFVLAPVHTKEAITEKASYYGSYFSVTTETLDTEENKMTINLNEDTDMARHVVLRLLVGLEINTVNVNGVELSRDDFMKSYIIE